MTTGGLANDQVSFLNSLLFLRIGRIGPCVRGKPKVERATDLLRTDLWQFLAPYSSVVVSILPEHDDSVIVGFRSADNYEQARLAFHHQPAPYPLAGPLFTASPWEPLFLWRRSESLLCPDPYVQRHHVYTNEAYNPHSLRWDSSVALPTPQPVSLSSFRSPPQLVYAVPKNLPTDVTPLASAPSVVIEAELRARAAELSEKDRDLGKRLVAASVLEEQARVLTARARRVAAGDRALHLYDLVQEALTKEITHVRAVLETDSIAHREAAVEQMLQYVVSIEQKMPEYARHSYLVLRPELATDFRRRARRFISDKWPGAAFPSPSTSPSSLKRKYGVSG